MLKKESNDQRCEITKKVVIFATSNVHKFNEAKSILGSFGLAVAMLRVKGEEIQSDSLQEIAEAAVTNAFRRTGIPIFVEDAGLFIEALDGFPGPYAAYAYKTIHNSGILKLMENAKDREAKFQSVIAYLDETLREPQVFEGSAEGKITETERKTAGEAAFGFDPIFQPVGSQMTFAEMSVEEKNCFSHRAKALRKFVEWYQKRIRSQ
jgi:XTP/dITP diphosphohydrolase